MDWIRLRRSRGYHVVLFCVIFYLGASALVVVLLQNHRDDYPLVLLDTTEPFSGSDLKELRLRLPRHGFLKLEISSAVSRSLSTTLVSQENRRRRGTIWREFKIASEFTAERLDVFHRSGYLVSGEYWLRIMSCEDEHHAVPVRVRITFTPG